MALPPDMFTHTPWWNMTSSVGGTVPLTLVRSGLMRVIQPSTCGFSAIGA